MIFVLINKNCLNIKNYFAVANNLQKQIYEQKIFWYILQKKIIQQKDKEVLVLPFDKEWATYYGKNTPIVNERYIKLILFNLYNDEDIKNRKQKTCIIDELMPVETLSDKEKSDLNFTKQLNKKFIKIHDYYGLVQIEYKSANIK